VTRDRNEATLRRHLAAEKRHDMDETIATLHPRCVFVDEPLGLRLDGRAGAREHYTIWWSAFGADIEDGKVFWTDDDAAIGTATFTGRHVGSFAGIAPTNRSIRVPFVVFVTFLDDLLSSERFIYDLNGLMRQLGQPAFEPVVASAK
jgi:SnoaL-like polyketide cyclase